MADAAAAAKKRDPSKAPQEQVSEFWDKFFTKKPGKVTSIFPRRLYATLLPPDCSRGTATTRNAAESYKAAAKECRERVRRAVRDCHLKNEKFTDPDFDIETDPEGNCLNGLIREDPYCYHSSDNSDSGDAGDAGDAGHTAGAAKSEQPRRKAAATASRRGRGVRATGTLYTPGSVHRVDWIFDSPRFTVDGYSASDIKQGRNGNCWWLAAVATIAHRKDLIDRVCVARDEEVGVYGFVFQRDGDFIPVLVDDNLFLTYSDYNGYSGDYDPIGRLERDHRSRHQTGSEALYFASCEDKNETWLPLLEKAYAKIHGDYEAIEGGWSGEGVEDMTGGVTTTLVTNRVLNKDKLWRELVNDAGDFVFALSAMGTGWDSNANGLALNHAYSILKAVEEVGENGDRVKLVQIRNPWGRRGGAGFGEWNGPWSDGSKEWTPYWLKKLGHVFGDDGVFWMSFRDMLEKFKFMHRTRLFDEKWTVVQQWTNVDISWVTGYLQSKFLLEVKKGGLVVISLSQLDERYFVGLEGQYTFSLHFVLEEENGKTGEHICRVRPAHDWENRSVSCEVELEAGRYEVIPKITATRDADRKLVEDIVQECAEKHPQKLRQIGMQYDLAHAKGGVTDEDLLLETKAEAKKRKEEEKKKKEKTKKEKEKAKKQKEKAKQLKEKREKKAKERKERAKRIAEKKEKKRLAKEAKAKEEAEAKKKAEKAKAEGEVAKAAEGSDAPTPASSTEKGSDDGIANVIKKPAEGETKADAVPATKGEDKANADSAPTGKDEDESDSEEEKEEAEEEEEQEEDEESDEEEAAPAAALTPDDDSRSPWNAVCVIGLRVFSRDSEVSIKLVKPKDAEEATSLSVGTTPAGATM
ncbi:calpain-9 [Gaeumannomyces tritici R3-111a-1]|uniref:Calpain-9 n=1 Tax=Gaeumannomyces tritici (strain R3-111a-1) TaxID=644352 RepID=J3PCH4_GAET3|nr:calpain-9 [Gaeumannomyces tritici R3-111a-1]EJT71944.1 calpain-9 [Gaeumannomyces tritici R3-111a-1]